MIMTMSLRTGDRGIISCLSGTLKRRRAIENVFAFTIASHKTIFLLSWGYFADAVAIL
jgi:hypothetical protein